MPVYPSISLPIPNFWTAYGHSYFMYAFGTRTPAGRADAIFRNLMNVDHTSWKNFSVAGSRLTQQGNSQGGWVRPMSTLLGAPPGSSSSGAPYVSQGGAYLLCWGINDVGFQGNTAQNCAAYAAILTAVISRCRASVVHRAGDAGAAVYGSGFSTFASNTAAWLEQSSGGSVAYTSSQVLTAATITITLPADYNGEPVVVGFIAQAGAQGGTVTYSGTAGVTGTTYTGGQQIAASLNYGYLIRRITGLTSAQASTTIIITVTSFDSGGSVLFDAWWIESDNPPPVLVCNSPRLNALGYSIYGFSGGGLTASGLSGTAVSSTPSTITVTSTLGLPTAGQVTMPSGSGTVTITFTGTTPTTFTGCVATGGGGNYSSNTMTWAGPVDADVNALNATLPAVIATFDQMVQLVDVDSALNKNAAWLGTDGLHPNDIGAARIADALATSLRRCVPNTGLGTAVSLEQASQRANALIRPMATGNWYTADSFGGPQSGNTYAMVANDWWAIPLMMTQSWLRWINYAVEVVAYGSGSPSILVGLYDDRNFTGYPQQAFNSPAPVTPFALGTSTGVKISPNSGAGSVNLPIDPGLYWVVIGVSVAGTGVTLRTIGGPSPYVPQILTATAAGYVGPTSGYKLTGQASTLPNSFPPLAVPTNYAPCVSMLMQ